jgi:hypothetical protein
MGLIEVIKRGGWQALKQSFVWLALVLFAGALPVGGSYLMIASSGRILDLREPLRHGELALFGISLLVSAVFVISRGTTVQGIPPESDEAQSGLDALLRLLKNPSFPGLLLFGPLVFVEGISATLLFAAAISGGAILPIDPNALDLRILLTAILLGLTVLTAFMVTFVDQALETAQVDAREMFGRDQRRWREQVDESWKEIKG